MGEVAESSANLWPTHIQKPENAGGGGGKKYKTPAWRQKRKMPACGKKRRISGGGGEKRTNSGGGGGEGEAKLSWGGWGRNFRGAGGGGVRNWGKKQLSFWLAVSPCFWTQARCEVHSTGPVPADWVPAAGPFSSPDARGLGIGSGCTRGGHLFFGGPPVRAGGQKQNPGRKRSVFFFCGLQKIFQGGWKSPKRESWAYMSGVELCSFGVRVWRPSSRGPTFLCPTFFAPASETFPGSARSAWEGRTVGLWQTSDPLEGPN